MKVLTVKLIEIFSVWLKDHTRVSCRISVKNEANLLKFEETVRFYLTDLATTDSVHILIQVDERVLGSQAFEVEWMFGKDLEKDLDDWVRIEVPSDLISQILKEEYKENLPNSLRVRIKAEVSTEKSMEKEQESKGEFEFVDLFQGFSPICNREKGKAEKEGASENAEEVGNQEELQGFEGNLDPDEHDLSSDESDLKTDKSEMSDTEKLPESQLLVAEDKPQVDPSELNPLSEKEIPTPAQKNPLPSHKKKPKILHKNPSKPPQTFPKFSSTTLCPYLNNLTNSEFNLNQTQKILKTLRNDLGILFSKFVGESIQRESRTLTRSPSRKLHTSSGHSPVSSQRSLNTSIVSNLRVEEENILEIVGSIDAQIEKVSVKNIDCLGLCAFAMIAKKTLGELQADEILCISRIIEGQKNASKVLESSGKASEHEFLLENKDFDVMITRIQEDNERILKNLEGKRKKNQLLVHEKFQCEEEIRKLQVERENILKDNSKSYIFAEIKQFTEAAAKLDKIRVEFEEKISASACEFSKDLSSISLLNATLAKEKSEVFAKITETTQEISELSKETSKCKAEFQALYAEFHTSEELLKILESYSSQTKSLNKYIETYEKQFLNFRTLNEEQSEDSIKLLQKIEYDTKGIKNSQINWGKAIESYSTILLDLNAALKKVHKENCYIEDVYNKKQVSEKAYENIFQKFLSNQDCKDKAIEEIIYFSDFVFSLNQSFLQQERISKKFRGIIAEKDMELEALRDAVKQIKIDNPIYVPLEADFIDEALGKYLNERDGNMLVTFVREAYGVYWYGTKKVMISVERGKVIVKVGGGYMPISVFIDNYMESEVEKQGKLSPRAKKTVQNYESGNLLDENLLRATHILNRAETPIIEEDI